MFVAPAVTETKVFAKLPEEFRVSDESNAVSRAIGKHTDSFLEGPSFDKDGNLYCVDVPYGRIFRIDPKGVFELVVQYDGQPNGLKIHRDGRLFVADRRHGIVVVDPDSHQIEYSVSGVDLERFLGPNDLVFSPGGDLYFTDQGMSDYATPTGRVFRLRSNGRVELLLDGLISPNGIALDESGRWLYVALTRANSVLKAMIAPDGRMSRVQNYIQLSGGGGPDGLAVDRDGGLVVAHPMMGVVWHFDERGRPRTEIRLCQGSLGTNVAFGGTDGRQLYITESETGSIQVADLLVSGISMFSHEE